MNRSRYCLIVPLLIFLFALPPFVHFRTQPKPGIFFSAPYICDNYSDENQYLIMLNSILQDRDLNLRNNYENSLGGGLDGGVAIRCRLRGRSTTVYDKNMRRLFRGDDPFYFNNAFSKGPLEMPDGSRIDLAGSREYSECNPGLSIFASLFLWPFKNSPLLEPLTVLLTTGAMLIGLYCLYKLLYFYSKDRRSSFFVTLCLAFGTPIWYYAGTFSKEPYLIALLLGAFYYLLVRNNNIVSAFLLGLLFFLRISSGAIVLFLAVFRLLSGKTKESVILLLPSILISPFVLMLHRIERVENILLKTAEFAFRAFSLLLQNPVIPAAISSAVILYLVVVARNAEPKRRKRIILFDLALFLAAIFTVFRLRIIFELLFSPRYGMFVFSPVLAFAVLGARDFYKSNKPEARLIYACIIFIILFYANMCAYHRPYPIIWGNRYYLFAVPLLSFPLLTWYMRNKSRLLSLVFCLFLCISVVINLEGAFANHIIRKFDLLQMWQRTVVVASRLFV